MSDKYNLALDKKIKSDLNHMSSKDRSEYLRGFCVLIRKNRRVNVCADVMFLVIGNFLGFEKEFCDHSLGRLLENQYISEKPAVFTSKSSAEFFLSDVQRLITLTVFDINLVDEWLQQTAKINNVEIFTNNLFLKIRSSNRKEKTMVRDPVCGMEIKDTGKAEKTNYKGTTYYFCTTLCRIQFEQEPEKYINKDDLNKSPHHHS